MHVAHQRFQFFRYFSTLMLLLALSTIFCNCGKYKDGSGSTGTEEDGDANKGFVDHVDDLGVPQNLAQAAKQGNPGAQIHLGMLYANGCGVLKNLTQAAKWYREAAEQGCVQAQHKPDGIHKSS